MARTKATPARKKRYTHPLFLKTLGRYCFRLREAKGFSIPRLASESEGLSSSVIHRLEKGERPVSILSLFRYGEVLGMTLAELLAFTADPAALDPEGAVSTPRAQVPVIPLDDPRAQRGAFRTLLPLYSLKAAAGAFAPGGEAVEPEGWVEVGGGPALDRRMFAARAVGNSMLPKIRSGDLLVFRADPGGSRHGRIVLAQYRGPADPDTGGSYTVKMYSSKKEGTGDGSWRHQKITLWPLNPDFEPIILEPKDKDDFRIVAEYLFSLPL